MSTDPYSMCPCGSGKKLKFCCGAMWPEFEKIERMLDAEQHQAALDAIARLSQRLPRHVYLLNLKIDALNSLGRSDEAEAATRELIADHPNDPSARARGAALRATRGELYEALREWYDAYASSGDVVHYALESSGQVIAIAAMKTEAAAAAISLLRILADFDDSKQLARSLLLEILNSPGVPLLQRASATFASAPEGVAWRKDFEAASDAAGRYAYPEAERLLSALAEKAPDSTLVWRNLAIVRCILVDHAGAAIAFEHAARCEPAWDDAVENEARAALYRNDPPAAVVEVLECTFELHDADRVEELLGSDRRFLCSHLAYERGDSTDVPPRTGVLVLDRPQPTPRADLRREDLPLVLANGFVFGRETDRPARLTLRAQGAAALDTALAAVKECTSEPLSPHGERTTDGTVPAERAVLIWRALTPRESSVDQAYELRMAWFRHAVLEEWPRQPLSILGGKSALEAASDPALRRRLAAAILLLELEFIHLHGVELFDELRTRLSVPATVACQPRQAAPDRPAENIPVSRLHRAMTAELSDDELIQAFNQAQVFGAYAAVAHLARELIRRPQLQADGRADLAQVYALLARLEADSRKSVEHIQAAEKCAVEARHSPAPYLVAELRLRLERNEPHEFERVMETLTRRHAREPGVREAILAVLQEAGLIGPHGEPTAPAQATAEPALVLPGGSQEPGKLWTPESEQRGGKGALWVPGME